MNGNLRIWAPATALTAVVIVATGFLLGVQPALASASTNDDATAAVVAQQQTTDLQLSQLGKQAARQTELDAQQEVLLKSVPSSLKANTFVRRVNELAALNGVSVSAINPGTGVAYRPPAATAAAGTTGTSTAKTFGATDPAITAKNLITVPMSVSAAGTPVALLQFTRDVQSDERLFLASTYALSVSAEDLSQSTVTLTGQIYALKR